jgi:hypothetical protein
MEKKKRNFINILAGLRRRPDTPVRQVGLDLAIYDPTSDRLHLLNAVASAVWRHITPDRTYVEVVDGMHLTFANVDHDRIAKDVRTVVQELKRLKLLVPVSEEARKPLEGRHEQLTLPDTAITAFTSGYMAPRISTWAVSDLEKQFGGGGLNAPFQDTWNIPADFREINVIGF